jgi:GntR family transcriptional regulator
MSVASTGTDPKQILLGGRVSIDSDVPLYYQLISIIKRNLSVGFLKPGDMIPSEVELCEALGISRSTVRQAIGELESEGLVVRRRGKGTFISEPKLFRAVEDIYSFTSEMKAMGLSPSSIAHGFESITPTDDVAKAMELADPTQKVYKIVRLRCANDEPLLLETTFIPVYLLPGLSKEAVETGSLYKLLRDSGQMVPDLAEETYEAMVIDESAAALLKCKPGIGGFFVERRTWGKNGKIFELTQSVIRGDRSKFVLKLKSHRSAWTGIFSKSSNSTTQDFFAARM